MKSFLSVLVFVPTMAFAGMNYMLPMGGGGGVHPEKPLIVREVAAHGDSPAQVCEVWADKVVLIENGESSSWEIELDANEVEEAISASLVGEFKVSAPYLDAPRMSYQATGSEEETALLYDVNHRSAVRNLAPEARNLVKLANELCSK